MFTRIKTGVSLDAIFFSFPFVLSCLFQARLPEDTGIVIYFELGDRQFDFFVTFGQFNLLDAGSTHRFRVGTQRCRGTSLYWHSWPCFRVIHLAKHLTFSSFPTNVFVFSTRFCVQISIS